MRYIATALLAASALSGPALSQDNSASDSEAPVVKRCLMEAAPIELRQCVQSMARLIDLGDRLRIALRNLARECAEGETVEAIRECLTPMTRPETPQQKKQSEELNAAVRTWDMNTETSRMDNSSLVRLSLEAEDEITIGHGKAVRPVLQLRCRENVTALFVYSDWYLNDSVSVQWRIDQEKPVAQTWIASTNKKAAGAWDGGRAIPLIKGMLGKKTFLIRVTTYNDGPKEMSFNIEGLDKVIEPLRAACKW